MPIRASVISRAGKYDVHVNQLRYNRKSISSSSTTGHFVKGPVKKSEDVLLMISDDENCADRSPVAQRGPAVCLTGTGVEGAVEMLDAKGLAMRVGTAILLSETSQIIIS